MIQKTPNDMIQELYTVILGVPLTDDKGMAQKVNEIEAHLRQLNGEVKTNTAWRKASCWAIGIIIACMGIMATVALD
jgi:hypothetical protein